MGKNFDSENFLASKIFFLNTDFQHTLAIMPFFQKKLELEIILTQDPEKVRKFIQ